MTELKERIEQDFKMVQAKGPLLQNVSLIQKSGELDAVFYAKTMDEAVEKAHAYVVGEELRQQIRLATIENTKLKDEIERLKPVPPPSDKPVEVDEAEVFQATDAARKMAEAKGLKFYDIAKKLGLEKNIRLADVKAYVRAIEKQ